MSEKTTGGRLGRRRSRFDEQAYLEANPDVAAAVAAGQFASGAQHYEVAGRAEGRGFVRTPSRNEIVRSQIDSSGPGLELGPLDRPVMPKREGFDVQIVDFLDTESLRTKYGTAEHPGIDTTGIEEVDLVSRGESLHELVGGERRFDWVVASHVIEHIPDLVAFLQDVERILRPEGRLALVVPDKRYTFDHYGELSTTGQLLDAHAERRTRPTPGQAFDHYARSVTLGGSNAWAAEAEGVPEMMHPYEAARVAYRRALDGDDFGGELHCWRFTPASFRLVMADLADLGLTTLGLVAEHDTVGCEFFVTLALGAAPTPTERVEAVQASRSSDASRPPAR
jgi:SAM-dependent methyltransferase